MLRMVRFLLSVLALAGILAAGPSGAFARARSVPSAHHHCMHMDVHMDAALDAVATTTPDTLRRAATDHCPGDMLNGLPACCVASACAMVQPLLAPHAAVAAAGFTRIDQPLRDDDQSVGVRAPPDLRPPIA